MWGRARARYEIDGPSAEKPLADVPVWCVKPGVRSVVASIWALGVDWIVAATLPDSYFATMPAKTDRPCVEASPKTLCPQGLLYS